ncbi:TetR/AcrR family transcriptional regulator [Neobacillus sp. LXY-1]|uniref:TetR/AcrR family transcriptional regulator n=1 Tax=Neobacillus sp. LXY-1 TaxID=3379133 RepID=UPI003EE32178
MVKKQLIMENALELFAKQGFESTSVQQITDKCGISKGAFYLSFKSKDELIIALIDQFMIQIVADIDYLVKSAETEQLLYEFYYSIYSSFQKHSDFAKLLIKEQSQLNKELFLKMQYYDKLMENSIISMIERLYGDRVEVIKYDLMYSIKGFMNMYSHLFVFFNILVDVNRLAESLVEKTNILAQHSTITFATNELLNILQPMNEEISEDQIIEMLDQKIEELDESIEKESLTLLKQQLIHPIYTTAIIKGLIENIRHHPQCKWITYSLRRYYRL